MYRRQWRKEGDLSIGGICQEGSFAHTLYMYVNTVLGKSLQAMEARKLEKLLRQVQNEFGFRIRSWNLVKHIADSSLVARIIAKDGKSYMLKSLFIPAERQRFIVESERRLAQEGVKLARPISTLSKHPFILYNETPYVLYEWIKGKTGQLRDRSDLVALTQVMARLHRRSARVVYPDDIVPYEHVRWEKEYRDRIDSLKSWAQSHQTPSSPKESLILRYLPFFEHVAEVALEQLLASDYDSYMNGQVAAKCLIHGDFHQKNLIKHKGEWVLIDFEDVRYDFPSKDLLRLYSMYTRFHPFDTKTFNSMMETYFRHHPLPAGAKRLMLTDFLFPHIVERTLRKRVYASMKTEVLKHWLKQEKRKARYVSLILSHKQWH